MAKKGLILAGGLGTRLFPLTKVITKQLLPVYDKPMIYYSLATLMEAGIRNIMLIVTKDDIDRFKKLLGSGSHLGIEIQYIIQESPKGIAQSFIIAKDFIGKDPITLILGDNIFYGEYFKRTLHQSHEIKDGGRVFAIEVEEPRKYGVIQKDESGKVVKLLEKPLEPPTNLAVTGLYYYDNNVIEIAKSLKPSDRGELEITDINNVYLENNLLSVIVLGKDVHWYDTGSFQSLQKAATFIQNTQNQTNELIGGIELIAYKNGWISKDEFYELTLKYQKSGYGNNLLVHL